MNKNKIEAVNNLNKYINKKVPKIINVLKKVTKLEVMENYIKNIMIKYMILFIKINQIILDVL